MSLHYLLDGYNILHQIPELAEKEIDQQRQYLISLIEQQKPQGSLKNKVTLVFDGRPGYIGVHHTQSVKIIFTNDQSADDRIKEIVGQSSNQKNFVIVTDDRAIQYAVKAFHASVCSVAQFLSRLSIKSTSGKSSGQSSTIKSRKLSQHQEININKELEEVWLKKKKK